MGEITAQPVVRSACGRDHVGDAEMAVPLVVMSRGPWDTETAAVPGTPLHVSVSVGVRVLSECSWEDGQGTCAMCLCHVCLCCVQGW